MKDGIIRSLLAPIAALSGHRLLNEAKALEDSGKFKAACYAYACALLNGGLINRHSTAERIRALWASHGPFDYDSDLKKEIEENGDTREHCAEAGHAAVMSIIKESIGKT